MKRIIILGILVLMSLVFAELASAGGGSTCGGAVPCSCGYSLTSSRTLDGSDALTGCGTYGLLINADNLVLDCNEYNITGLNTNRGIVLGSRTNVTVQNCNVYNFSKGMELSYTSDDTITGNTVKYNDIGLDVHSSSTNNIITNNTAVNNTQIDIRVAVDATNNKFYSNTIGSLYPTTFSFTEYSGEVNITGVESPNAPPTGNLSISKYINIEGPSWMYLNLSYSDPDVSGIDESTLKIYRYSGGWSAVSGSTVDTANNVISANLTAFSDFGGFGDPAPAGGYTAVPEFSDYAMILIIVTAIGGFYFVKRKQK
jgi:parallel beta-helix repeat protein